MIDINQSLQDQFAPHNACFGCGPANEKGLRIKSYYENGVYRARWQAEPHHEAFPGMLNGGIIGTLLDCHSNWTAAVSLMQAKNLDTPPCTVTAFFNVTLKRPTPSQSLIELIAEVDEIKGDQVLVSATLSAESKVCATCLGKFIAVKEGHPAYHRW